MHFVDQFMYVGSHWALLCVWHGGVRLPSLNPGSAISWQCDCTLSGPIFMFKNKVSNSITWLLGIQWDTASEVLTSGPLLQPGCSHFQASSLQSAQQVGVGLTVLGRVVYCQAQGKVHLMLAPPVFQLYLLTCVTAGNVSWNYKISHLEGTWDYLDYIDNSW